MEADLFFFQAALQSGWIVNFGVGVGENEVATRGRDIEHETGFDMVVQPSAHLTAVFALDADAVVACGGIT